MLMSMPMMMTMIIMIMMTKMMLVCRTIHTANLHKYISA